MAIKGMAETNTETPRICFACRAIAPPAPVAVGDDPFANERRCKDCNAQAAVELARAAHEGWLTGVDERSFARCD